MLTLNKKIFDWTIKEITPYEKRRSSQYVLECKCGNLRNARKYEVLSLIENGIGRNTLYTSCKECRLAEKYNNRIEKKTKQLYAGRIQSYRASAKKKKIAFDLTDEQIVKIFKSDCYYCGMEPSNNGRVYKTNYDVQFKYQGIDRIDSTLGYTIHNVVPCCKQCNIAKLDHTKHDFLNWVKRVYKVSVEGSTTISEESTPKQVETGDFLIK